MTNYYKMEIKINHYLIGTYVYFNCEYIELVTEILMSILFKEIVHRS